MASLHLTTPPSPLTFTRQTTHHPNPTKLHTTPTITTTTSSRHLRLVPPTAYKVVIQHEGTSTELDVEPDETILSKALDTGIPVPHDCKLGVCMTCPAKVLTGTVDQSEGMLSDDVVERGYALMCVAYPKSDCTIRTIPEEELLSLQLATAND